MAITSRPASVSSCARIEPVQPRPTITASFGGSLRGMAESAPGSPLRSPADADGRVRVTLVVAAHPVAIVITRARKADHLPSAHVTVGAVDGIGEEPCLGVLQQRLEKLLAVDLFEAELAAFEIAQNPILPLGGQPVEAQSALRRPTMPIQSRKSCAIKHRRSHLGLGSLLFCARREGSAGVQAFTAAVGAR